MQYKVSAVLCEVPRTSAVAKQKRLLQAGAAQMKTPPVGQLQSMKHKTRRSAREMQSGRPISCKEARAQATRPVRNCNTREPGQQQGAKANRARPGSARRSTGQAHRTLHRRPRTPFLRKPAAQNTPPVASASAAILERLRAACHETLHPSGASRAKAGSSTACVQGLCNRPWAAQCLTTARLSPEIRTRRSPSGRSRSNRTTKCAPQASAT